MMNSQATGIIIIPLSMVFSLFVGVAHAEYQTDHTVNGVIVQGKVKLSGLPKDKSLLPVYRDPEFCGEMIMTEGAVVDSATNGLADVVVSIEGIERGKALTPSEAPVILQIESAKCQFTPHLSTTVIGATLEVRNNDPILHNLHIRRDTRFGPTLFNVIQPAGTRSVQKPFREAGFFDVRCDVHAFMSAFLHVFDHPYFATTDHKGDFAISGVPPGVYKIKIWHEQFGVREKSIKVPPGEGLTVDLEMGKNMPLAR